jgi:hypothetical protein
MLGMMEEILTRRSDECRVAALVTLALASGERLVLEFDQQIDSQLPLALAGSVTFSSLYVRFLLKKFPAQVFKQVLAKFVKGGDHPRP